MLAGVGTTWYTWLEQGRDIRPSVEVLEALVTALRLDGTERRHLFALGDRAEPAVRGSGPEKVSESLERMLQSLDQQPAYVMGRRWDILAWNRAAVALFGEYGRLSGDARNSLHMLFANPGHRRMLVDWDRLAPNVLATFRAESARYAGDPDFERLIGLLHDASAEFRLWWPRHDVLPPVPGVKRIEHPVAGRMEFEYTSFTVTGSPEMSLVVYTPLAASNSIARLAALLGHSDGPAAQRAQAASAMDGRS